MLVQNGSLDSVRFLSLSSKAESVFRCLLQDGIANIAINDSFMLEGAIYFLLKKHFKGEKYYVDLLELFHDVCRLLCLLSLLLLIR